MFNCGMSRLVAPAEAVGSGGQCADQNGSLRPSHCQNRSRAGAQKVRIARADEATEGGLGSMAKQPFQINCLHVPIANG